MKQPWILVGAIFLIGCAGAVRPAQSHRNSDALLVLPGFGYDRAAQESFETAAQALSAEGIDLYVPDYLRRSGFKDTRDAFLQFYDREKLSDYERLHVFAFIAGAWTFNPSLDKRPFENLSTVIYDRSPLQERAPRLATEELHFPTWLLFGQLVFQMADSAYQPIDAGKRFKVGIMVETKPTALIERYRETALSYGTVDFSCDQLNQGHDDCIFIPLNHDEMYTRFSELLPEILHIIREGKFRAEANRQPPANIQQSAP